MRVKNIDQTFNGNNFVPFFLKKIQINLAG